MVQDNTARENERLRKAAHGWLAWVVSVLGWLVCAALCLMLSIRLEEWPYAYDMFFPAILLILFCNILVFLFVTTRWGGRPGKLVGSIIRVCVGEGLLLAMIYVIGKFCIGR